LQGGVAALVTSPTVIKRLGLRRCVAHPLNVELADAAIDEPGSAPSMLLSPVRLPRYLKEQPPEQPHSPH
jgi:hypothetical protein